MECDSKQYIVGHIIKKPDKTNGLSDQTYYSSLEGAMDGLAKRVRMEAVSSIEEGTIQDVVSAIESVNKKLTKAFSKLDTVELKPAKEKKKNATDGV